MNLWGRSTAIVIFTLIAGTSVLGEPSDLNYHRRGDQQWHLSFGAGKNYRLPGGTLVPRLEFNVAAVEFETFTSSTTSIGYQLSVAGQTNHGDNDAISVFSNYRRYFLVHGRFSVNYKLGLGVMRLNDAVRGQATRNNFNEQVGVGLQYATGSNSAITLDYTLYHASNAGIERPNDGITATIVAVDYCRHR